MVHRGRSFYCEREVCECLCSTTDKIMETINICLKVLRNNKKAVKRRFQLKQVPEFSSVSELKNFVVTEKSSVSFFTKIQIRIFNPKRDISFFFNKSPKRSLPNDPQRTNGGGFIGSYPKPDTLKGFPHYGSEKSEYYQRQLENILYIHQLFDETAYHSAICELESWIKVALSLIQEH